MNDILIKLIKGDKIEKKDIVLALDDICDSVHATCGDECPVFEKNKGIPWNKDKDNCKCFKSGKKMLSFLK